MWATRSTAFRSTLLVSRRAKQKTDAKWQASDDATTQPPRPKHNFGVRSEGRPHAPDIPAEELGKQAWKMRTSIMDIERDVNQLGTRVGGALHFGTVAASSTVGEPRALDTIRVGDFVEFQTPVGTSCGVVLPAADITNTYSHRANVTEFDVVSITGEVRTVYTNAVLFYVPQFIDPSVAEEARIVMLEESTVSRGYEEESSNVTAVVQERREDFDHARFKARALICSQLRTFLQQTEFRKQALFDHFEKTYLSRSFTKTLGNDRTSHYRSASDIAAELMRQSGMDADDALHFSSQPASIFAAHQLITSAPHIFHMDSTSHMSTKRFRVLTEREQDVSADVRRSVMQSLEQINSPALSVKEDPLKMFAKRVKDVRLMRKEAFKKLSDAGAAPSTKHFGESINARWTKGDRSILRFLRATLGERRKMVTESEMELALYVLKQCGYELEVAPKAKDSAATPALELLTEEKKLIMAFFRDLGYLAPWDDQATLTNEFMTHNEPANVKVTSLSLKDDGHLRRDHHEEVYVIDDEDAAELDDGLSIERTKDADVSWVHIHIADPTAAMKETDLAAKDAEQRFSSVYLTQGKWSMLPTVITSSLGLRPNEANKGQPLRAMTFSAKVHHTTGKVSEIDVSLSRLHNVKVMSYAKASERMDESRERDATKDIRLLHRIAKAVCQHRVKAYGAIQFAAPGSGCKVELSPTPLPASPLRQTDFTDASCEPCLFTGDATLKVVPDTTQAADQSKGGMSISSSQLTVTEMALLAGRTAAKFAHVRHIPALYRFQPAPGRSADRDRMLALRNEFGEITAGAMFYSNIVLSAASVSTEPCEHFLLGVRTRSAMMARTNEGDDLLADAGYVRVTSPLRRYADLMMHWKFRAFLTSKQGQKVSYALADEKRRLEPITSKTSNEIQQLRSQLALITRMERWHRSLERASTRAWRTLWLYNAFKHRTSPTTSDDLNRSGFVRDPAAEEFLSQTHVATINRPGVRSQDDGDRRASVDISGIDLPGLCLLPQRLRAVSDVRVLNADRMFEMGNTFPVRIIDVQQTPGNTAILVEPA